MSPHSSQIAAYLLKGVRTVQGWELQFGLPVSRPKKAAKGVVLPRWRVWTDGWQRSGVSKPGEGVPRLNPQCGE